MSCSSECRGAHTGFSILSKPQHLAPTTFDRYDIKGRYKDLVAAMPGSRTPIALFSGRSRVIPTNLRQQVGSSADARSRNPLILLGVKGRPGQIREAWVRKESRPAPSTMLGKVADILYEGPEQGEF